MVHEGQDISWKVTFYDKSSKTGNNCLNKYLNTGPQPGVLREEISNSNNKIYFFLNYFKKYIFLNYLKNTFLLEYQNYESFEYF